ncbi:MAG: D-alanyl-D-alanine carboxypeptidase [Clostridia bacterium]|nr:D-alanyl-D-alanine carboxypeptidase [Clostridia bacterium]
MKQRIQLNRLTGIALSLVFLFLCLPFAASAEEPTPPSMEEATSVWFSHIESDRLICSKEADANVGAGSSVKVMAGLLFCELLQGYLLEEVYITDALLEFVPPTPGRSLHVEAGDVVTVQQLLYAAICGSYNDVFYILATYTSGSLDAFLTLMNERAVELGVSQTTFMDVTGILDGSRTTAADMAKIAMSAYQNALYMELSSTVSFPFSSQKLSKNVYNRNALVCQYETQKYYHKYCRGISAGTTTKDGNCVITVSEYEGERYLCVVLGGKEIDNIEYGYRVATRLIDWVYDTYTYMEVMSPNTTVCTIPVTVSDMTTEVSVYAKESLYAYLPRGVEIGKEITYSIRLNQTELEAPVQKNQFVGYVAVLYDDRVLGTVPLYTADEAVRSSVISSLKVISSWSKNRAIRAGVIFFVVAVAAYLTVEYVLYRRRRNKWDRYFSNKVELPDHMRTQSRSRNDRSGRR